MTLKVPADRQRREALEDAGGGATSQELALKASEEKYRALFNSITQPVFVANEDASRFLDRNDAVPLVYGYTREEILALKPADLHPPKQRGAMRQEVDSGGFGASLAHTHVTKDGRLLDVEITALPTDYHGQRARIAIVSDITESKRAVESLRASESRYRLLFETNVAAVIRSTIDGRIVDCNVPAARVLGYESPQEVLGFRMQDVFWVPEERAALMARLHNEKTLAGVEVHLRRKDGRSAWTIANVNLTRAEGTGETFIQSTLVDITERKQSEEALRHSEAVLREALVVSQMGTWELTLATDTVTWDENLYRLAGRDPNLPAPSFAEYPQIFVPESWERLTAAAQSALGNGTSFELDLELIRPDGSKRWVIGRGQPLRDSSGHIARLRGTVQDITERKLREAENTRLVTAIEQCAETVLIANNAGEIQYVNPAFTRVTGYTPEEVLGRNPRFLKSGKQDPAFYRLLWATILKGEVWNGELINRRKDGKLYTAELQIAPVRDARGEITHFIATEQDVTKRRLLEDQFRQAQKMEAVGRLAGGVAHDFNNLLTVINGYTGRVLESLKPGDPNWGRLEEVRKAGDRAASLTRQLLLLSRQQVLEPRVLDLNAVVGDVEKMLRRLLGEDIKIAMVREPGLGRVKVDPGQAEQILMNLAVNARDAMPEGGKLIIETANVELHDAYPDRHVGVIPGRYVMLAMNDTGIGMDVETQAYIFDPFFTTKEKGKGTGLGLAMVYGAVQQSGGYIWVYSEPGRGATFKIYLPRVDEVGERVQASDEREHSVAGSETILLVEDETAVLDLVTAVLQGLGYEVLESANFEEAVQIGDQHKEPIHLLLTDVVLPGKSGPKIAEHLALSRPGIKILYMSGYTDDAVVRHGILRGEAAFLQKPFTPNALARKVRDVLDADRAPSA